MIALRLDGYQHEIGLKNQARRSPRPSFLCHHSFEKAKESFESTSGVSNKETHWHFVDCSYMFMQAGLFKTLDRSWLIYIPHWWMTRMDNIYRGCLTGRNNNSSRVRMPRTLLRRLQTTLRLSFFPCWNLERET